ncbi:winged helix-turn-helix transcriptional regulator [Streptomyces sp. NPDC048331]|uniref:winged helix-turn-helix transcriptional regulator n=1 Tax=Streptomyces sp. NPDC048331 TaxID=3365534 RepID=UPI00371A6733
MCSRSFRGGRRPTARSAPPRPPRLGLVVRTVCPGVPLYVEYALTELGSSVALPLMQMKDRGEAHLPEISGVEDA